MLNTTYRSAVLTDVPQLVKLRVLMQCEVNSLDPSKVTAEFTAAIENYFVKSLKDQSYFSAVAELNGQLISANGLVIYRDKSLKDKSTLRKSPTINLKFNN